MSHDDNITARTKRTQQTVFREAQARGLTLKVIAIDSGLGYTTVQSYARGEAAMSLPALVKLIGVIPADLISMLFPDGWQLVPVPEDINHDEFCDLITDYRHMKDDAHRPESPAGRDLSPCELDKLDRKVAQIRGA